MFAAHEAATIRAQDAGIHRNIFQPRGLAECDLRGVGKRFFKTGPEVLLRFFLGEVRDCQSPKPSCRRGDEELFVDINMK
jgi:hypothetical protein